MKLRPKKKSEYDRGVLKIVTNPEISKFRYRALAVHVIVSNYFLKSKTKFLVFCLEQHTHTLGFQRPNARLTEQCLKLI